MLTSVGLKARGPHQRSSCCETSRKFWAGVFRFWGELTQAPGTADFLSAGLGSAAVASLFPSALTVLLCPLPGSAGAKWPRALEPSWETCNLCFMSPGCLGQHNPPCPDFCVALGVLVSNLGPGVLKRAWHCPFALCRRGYRVRQQATSVPSMAPGEGHCLHSMVLEQLPYFPVLRNLPQFLWNCYLGLGLVLAAMNREALHKHGFQSRLTFVSAGLHVQREAVWTSVGGGPMGPGTQDPPGLFLCPI